MSDLPRKRYVGQGLKVLRLQPCEVISVGETLVVSRMVRGDPAFGRDFAKLNKPLPYERKK